MDWVRELKTETRNERFLEFGAAYTRGFTVASEVLDATKWKYQEAVFV